jgi:5-methyltetrahydrofolate corrinoid/iron sulfur protein methyltransferase
MKWAVQLLSERFDNVPLCLDTANKKRLKQVFLFYKPCKRQTIVNSADAGDRIENIDLAAANDCYRNCVCAKDGIPSDNDERWFIA